MLHENEQQKESVLFYNHESGMKYTKDQRDFMIANVNNIIGASAVVLVQELSSYPINPIIITGLIWFIYFTVVSALCIFIYNSLKNKYDFAIVYKLYSSYIAYMKKLIDIPDNIVNTLKIKAIKAGKSFKGYLESLIIKDAK